MAAHWGNREFHQPGRYAESHDPLRLQAEVILAIAQHDNGWWEWEAAPEVSAEDGLPLGLTELVADQQQAMERWRTGIPRFKESHPYVSLLISYHAYWLYAVRCEANPDPAFMHPLFLSGVPPQLSGSERTEVERFLEEVKLQQDELTQLLTSDEATSAWIQAEHLAPHVRLLQLLDGLSLALCSRLISQSDCKSGELSFMLTHVPRRSWADQVEINVSCLGRRRFRLQPYPFDTDPLTVQIPTRVIAPDAIPDQPLATWWHRLDRQLVEYQLGSSESPGL